MAVIVQSPGERFTRRSYIDEAVVVVDAVHDGGFELLNAGIEVGHGMRPVVKDLTRPHDGTSEGGRESPLDAEVSLPFSRYCMTR